MAGRYVPEAGDVVWLPFNPQTGYEQPGHRPALVVSPRSYNGKAGLSRFARVRKHYLIQRDCWKKYKVTT